MICFPLIDKKGKCIGVLQSINKNEILFFIDDEELMTLDTRYCEEIIENAMQYERKVSYTSQMKLLIKYSLDIRH